jgi:hypothetical protein
MRGDWPSRRPVLRDGLLALNADLLTLQETIAANGYDQAADILDSRYQGWPVGETIELDINVTSRTSDFACTSLITEILAPPPLGRIWLVNNIPDWQPDHEHERELQAVRTATAVEDLLTRKPGHVIVAGDFDADPAAASIRFWTGRQSLNGHSVCYRDAWESARPGEPGHTFVPGNPNSADWDWPYRRIDYILIRCAQHGGPPPPSPSATACRRLTTPPAPSVTTTA